MPRRIVIDTDPGIDDAMAIFYALRSPELDVLGLTTVYGNAWTPIATANALRLLEIAGRPDIPVAQGAEQPLFGAFDSPADFVHGADGQGDTHLPPPSGRALDVHAAQFLIDTVMSDPGNVTIVALGPLTNLALALKLRNDLDRSIREIVLMGGNAFVPGNASPAAEANTYNDPEASDMVFGAACPVTMVGLDVTMNVRMLPADLARFAEADDPMCQHIARMLPCYRRFYSSRSGIDYIPIHDSTTISWLRLPQHFTARSLPIRVDTVGIGRGKTWPSLGEVDAEGPWLGRPPVNVLVDVNGPELVRAQLDVLMG